MMPTRNAWPVLDPSKPESMAAWGQCVMDAFLHMDECMDEVKSEVATIAMWKTGLQGAYDRRQVVKEADAQRRRQRSEWIKDVKLRFELLLAFLAACSACVGVGAWLF